MKRRNSSMTTAGTTLGQKNKILPVHILNKTEKMFNKPLISHSTHVASLTVFPTKVCNLSVLYSESFSGLTEMCQSATHLSTRPVSHFLFITHFCPSNSFIQTAIRKL